MKDCRSRRGVCGVVGLLQEGSLTVMLPKLSLMSCQSRLNDVEDPLSLIITTTDDVPGGNSIGVDLTFPTGADIGWELLLEETLIPREGACPMEGVWNGLSRGRRETEPTDAEVGRVFGRAERSSIRKRTGFMDREV